MISEFNQVMTTHPPTQSIDERLDEASLDKISGLDGASPILQVSQLSKTFRSGRSEIRSVSLASFSVYPGKTMGIVGESGSGKSTLGRCIMRLIQPDSGALYLHGEEYTHATGNKLLRVRKSLQMIFQDPYASLNPRFTVFDTLSEPLIIHDLYRGTGLKKRVLELLDIVSLPSSAASRYPHEFSGGQRQRIGIARALAAEPSLIVADEPISALDVSIQAQVINLLSDLQYELGIAYIFIAHDLSIVRHLSDDIIVMQQGRIVEQGACETIYNNPQELYTQELLNAIPIADPILQKKRWGLN